MSRPTVRIWLHRICCAWAALMSLGMLLSLPLGGPMDATTWRAVAVLSALVVAPIAATVLLGLRKKAGWWLSFLLGAYGLVALVMSLGAVYDTFQDGAGIVFLATFALSSSSMLALFAAGLLAVSTIPWTREPTPATR